MPDFSLKLCPAPPFRLDLTAWALRRRPHNLVDRIEGGRYRRILALGERLVDVSMEQRGSIAQPSLIVTIRGRDMGRRLVEPVAVMLNRMLGLDRDLREFHERARDDATLGPMVERLRGLKPVRFPTNFEAFTNAVTCQQISLDAGLHVLNRLAANYGRAIDGSAHAPFAFPDAGVIAQADVERLRELGLSRSKALYMVGLATAAADPDSSDFAALESLDDERTLASLLGFKGVGRWTAEYVMLRGLGRTHIFPGDDVGGRKLLARRLGLSRELDYPGVREALARWHPFGGLIYLNLLVDALTERGITQPSLTTPPATS